MATEITQDNLNQVVREIERALVEFDNVTPFAGLKCDACGQEAALEHLEEFAKGAAYVPPNPLPKKSRVVDLFTGRHGKVVENKIICLAEGHAHRRLVTIQPNGGGGQDLCQIEEGYDGCSEHFVLEEEWEAQQEGGGGVAQGD